MTDLPTPDRPGHGPGSPDATGTLGSSDASGTPGATGSSDATGTQGSSDATGTQGSSDATGTPGATGATGTPGATGATGTPGLRRGVRVGIDVGTVRVGVARCDAAGILATPVRTVARRKDGADVTEIAELVRELEALEVLVGLPRSLSGKEGRSAQAARGYAVRVAAAVDPVPVRLVDERLTTVSAHQALHASGRPGRRHREVVDQVAAVMIVEQALEVERRSGTPAGELVRPQAPEKDVERE